MHTPCFARNPGWWIVLWSLPVLLSAGCFTSVNPNLDTIICQTDKQCPKGYVCAVKGQAGGCKRPHGADAAPVDAWTQPVDANVSDSRSESADRGAPIDGGLVDSGGVGHFDALADQSTIGPDVPISPDDSRGTISDGDAAGSALDAPTPPDAPLDQRMISPEARDGAPEAHDAAHDVPMDIAPCNGGCCTKADCPLTAPICNAANQCIRCVSDTDCAGRSATACNTSTGACVQCTQNSHCGGTTTTCDTASNRCVGCTQRSDCPGACQTCTNNVCTAVRTGDDPTGCAGTCDSNGDCRAKRGQRCDVVSGGCIAGTTCADNYCCDQACTSPCMACNLATHEGTCTAVPSGDPPAGHGTCGTDAQCKGSCTGRSDGLCTYPTSACGSPSCSGTNFVPGGHCASGTCSPDTAQTCDGGLICSSKACKTSCGLDTDCRSDYFCSNTTCHPDATAVSSYGGHVCVLDTDRTIHCWGLNDRGQLGDGTVSVAWSTSPSTVSGINNATAVYAGGNFTCALLSDATVRCWGSNMMGALGIGDSATTHKTTPVAPVGLSSVVALAVSNATVCAVEQAGTVKCWGYNGGSGVVLGSTNFYDYTPTPIAGISGAKAIALGNLHACVLLTDGTPKCWGQNDKLQAGAPKSTSYVDAPRTADETGSGYTSVTAGGNHTCVLKNGTATCWGDNWLGQLGNSTVLTPQPAQVLTMISGISVLSAGENSTCALLTNGNVWCWGPVMSSSSSAATVYPAQVNVTGAKTVVGNYHSCAVLGNGSVACWGWRADSSPPGHYLPSSPVVAAGW